MRIATLLLILNSNLFICAQGLYFPPASGTNWDTLSISSQNYCQPQVDSLYAYLDTNNTKAFLLLKDGKIVLEKYFDSFQVDSNWYWASSGKTLTAFLVGIAQANGNLNSNDTTQQYLGASWTSLTQAQEEKITIKNQLSMTTGLNESIQPDCTIDTCLTYRADAGTRWAYHNAPYTLLDSVLFSATGQNINQYLFSEVKSVTGMNGLYIKLGFNNVYFSTARSMARFGLLLLNKGVWNGITILNDSNYFNQMINSSQSINPSYGYLTWLNGKSTYMLPQSQLVFNGSLCPDAPNDMYAALGRDGQVINIAPSQNLIWIRMGNAPAGGNGLILPSFNNEIWKRINDLTCGLTSLDKNENKKTKLKIFPIPATEIVNLKSVDPISSIQLYSSSGFMLTEEKVTGTEHKINMERIPQGVYFLRINFKDTSQIVKKVIIQ